MKYLYIYYYIYHNIIIMVNPRCSFNFADKSKLYLIILCDSDLS